MTVSEHLEQNSFAYDAQFPPDCEEGRPLSSVRPERAEPTRMKRALRSCARLITRRG
ncbi:MAG: hypothetical protein QOG63_2900 [Thermoleophilaceae bacterium]|jgi:hypothetical protein|nr:hypothetical protein [Thermoleophilaceae bacterium]